ncbi:MAG: 5-histidylcysteine sulfoxide synthase/putative 4-mercaptohistidine N1-methyltransferase [Candidatus Azotimanducaceae bacterium]|jgi:5-histidylcysteine sulfoxide synthase/putative 4-mercaptohistidine N1-methyltranferase
MDIQQRISKTLRLDTGSSDTKRQELKAYFNQTFSLYESLFRLISDDTAHYTRAEPLRHPLVFYFGHTATFFVNKLLLAKLIDKRIDPDLEAMFAIGVDEMSWDDMNDAHYDWPAISAVRDYRDLVRERVNQLIDALPITLPITQEDPAWVILMGIEHERIHLETSSVIIRMLDIDAVTEITGWEACHDKGAAPSNQLVPISPQRVNLGKATNDTTYGWDNEYGHKQVLVDEFEVSQHLVSNGEFLKFVDAGGYATPRFWTPEGQQWLAFTRAEMPRFWLRKAGVYWQRNLASETKLPLNWPVEVNYLEAKAFCNWQAEVTESNIRLPTEAEWSALRANVEEDQVDWHVAPGNINLEYFASSCPVDRFATDINQNQTDEQIFDVIGNVWQWTETPIDTYPGFQVHPIYDDFSTPTFDGKHNLMKGGSWIATGNESLRNARYAFRRHFHQHAGFRYIKAKHAELPVDKVNTYETDTLVSQYLEFHYGEDYFSVPNFPKACIEATMAVIGEGPRGRALDLGCAVGRSTFEFGRHFAHVDGIDFSARFIQSAFQLKENGQVRYTIPTEGSLVDYQEKTLQEMGLADLTSDIEFSQGDATNLKPQFTDYDLIFAGNLIDRLYQPKLFLDRIKDRINDNGWLVFTSPYTWLEEYTDVEHWLGGIKVNGENFSTLDGLQAELGEHFVLRHTQDVPFVIRETRRKYQHSIAEMSVWQKK